MSRVVLYLLFDENGEGIKGEPTFKDDQEYQDFKERYSEEVKEEMKRLDWLSKLSWHESFFRGPLRGNLIQVR